MEIVKNQLRQIEKESLKNEYWRKKATKEKKELREELEAKIKYLTVSLHNSKAQVERERRLKERATEASRVTLGVWAEKCHETKDAKEYTQYWKDRF